MVAGWTRAITLSRAGHGVRLVRLQSSSFSPFWSGKTRNTGELSLKLLRGYHKVKACSCFLCFPITEAMRKDSLEGDELVMHLHRAVCFEALQMLKQTTSAGHSGDFDQITYTIIYSTYSHISNKYVCV